MPRETYEAFTCDGCGKREEVKLERGRSHMDPPPEWVTVLVHGDPKEGRDTTDKLYHSAECAADYITNGPR